MRLTHSRSPVLCPGGRANVVRNSAHRIAIGAVALALLAACQADDPTRPFGQRSVPTQPELVLTGSVGTPVLPIVQPGEPQPHGSAIGLNEAGQVAGAQVHLVSLVDDIKPFRWTPGVGAVAILGCCTTGYGTDINAAGVVVGTTQVSNVIGPRGFVATGSTMVTLPILPGGDPESHAGALAINDAGQIAGYSPALGDQVHAVLWSANGAVQDLGTLGGSFSRAIEMNASAQVIGWSQLAGDAVTHYFLWTPGSGMQDLNTLIDPNVTSVVEINDAAQIVGTYTTSGGASHAFLYTPGSGLRDLGTLGGTTSAPTGLNQRGDVVGSSTLADGSTHAFLWTDAYGMEDITLTTSVPEVRRLNNNLQTLTGTLSPTQLSSIGSGIPRLVQLQVTQGNVRPTALFTWTCNGLTCTLDASGSLDDKPGLTYSWDLGKYPGGTATGALVTTTYPHSGQRMVTLTVTDANGLTSTLTQTVSVFDAPIAAFTFSCTGLTCTFDSSPSSNAGNPIARRFWYFGDGQTAAPNVATITHTFAQAGTYNVTLEVWGVDKTQRGFVSQQVTVAAAQNQPPVASFTASCPTTTCTFDATSSTDDNGIVSYVWNLDVYPGGSATGSTVTTTYPHLGLRNVTLTVTDAQGLTSSITKQIDVGVDAPPVASFTWSCTNLTCTFDASSSSDDVGIASYAWNLDKYPGGSATGVQVTADYPHTGTRNVTLTVTDTNGKMTSLTQTITVQ